MNNSSQITKRQHWIPKFYLKEFIDKSNMNRTRFWVYDRNKALTIDGYQPSLQTPKKFAQSNFFYEVSGAPDNAVEEVLQVIEDNFAKICKNKIKKYLQLNDSDRYWTSLFIATLETRTESSKHHVEKFYDELIEGIKQLETVHNMKKKSKAHLELEEMKNSNFGFAQFINVAIEVNRWQHSDYQILYIEPRSKYNFVSGNHPVCLYDMTEMNSMMGINPLSPTIEVTVPLSPKLTLFINNAGITGYRNMSNDYNFVNEINSRTIHNNAEFIISGSKLKQNFFKSTINRNRQSIILLNYKESIWQKFDSRHSEKRVKV